MRAPTGLQPAGKRLWKSITSVFSFEDEPGKTELLAQACRVADCIAELDDAAAEAPLTVKGSQNQSVISPLISESRFQRGLLAQLIGKLGLPDSDDDAEFTALTLSTVRAQAGRSRRLR